MTDQATRYETRSRVAAAEQHDTRVFDLETLSEQLEQLVARYEVLLTLVRSHPRP